MKKIKITINNQEFEAQLNNTKTAEKIYDVLPPASPVTVVGKIKADPEALQGLKGAEVRIEKVE